MRYFIAVAGAGSFRKAAEQLHVAASAINRHIIEFEGELGTPLFERLPKGLRLTPAGKILLETVTRLRRDYDSGIAEIDLLKQNPQGHVKIATMHVFAEDVFPPILRDLLAEYPGITYSFVVRDSVESARLVVEDQADIALANTPPRAAPVKILKSCPVPFGAAMRPDHPLAQLGSVKLSDCVAYPLIIQPSGEMRETLDRIRSGLPAHRAPVVETESAPMYRELALNGTGVALTTLVAVIVEVTRGDLVFRPLHHRQQTSVELCLYQRADRALSAAARPLVERLEACFTQGRGFKPPELSRLERSRV